MRKKKQTENFLYKFGVMVARSRLVLFEWLYFMHLKIRYIHDKTYGKGGAYKKWTDKGYSATIHRAVLVGFIISFLIFLIP